MMFNVGVQAFSQASARWLDHSNILGNAAWGTRRSQVESVVSDKEVETHLHRLCNSWRHKQPSGLATTQVISISKREIAELRTYLEFLDAKEKRTSGKAWSHTPLTYAILRSIGGLEYMSLFRQSHSDFHLPYSERTLPSFLPDDDGKQLRQLFLGTQRYFLTEMGKRIETDGVAEHFSFDGTGDFHFQPVKMLGQGSYGGVDLVWSRLSLTYFARKRVSRGRDSDRNREAQAFLINELKQLKRLKHIHLVNIVASYTDNEYISYIMLPVADCTLEALLASTSSISPDAKTMLRTFYGCLAGAVNFLHQNKVRHRDVTARNILIQGSQVFICDFGSAYDWSNRTAGATRHFNTPVSPDYMAPEVARREERDSKSDMFSLGVVFLEMTTRLLDRSLADLRKALEHHSKKNKSNSSHVWANLSGAVAWLGELRKGNTLEHDNEPLAWVRVLIHEKPSNRPTAMGLMQDIVDTPSFRSFCCFKCHQEYEERTFEYDTTPQHQGHLIDSLSTNNIVANMFGEPGTGNGASHSRSGKSQEVERWLDLSAVDEEQEDLARIVKPSGAEQSRISTEENGPGHFPETRYASMPGSWGPPDWFSTGAGFDVSAPGIDTFADTTSPNLAEKFGAVSSVVSLAISQDSASIYTPEIESDCGVHEPALTFRDTGLGFQECGSSDSEDDEPSHRLFNEVSDGSDTSSDDSEETASLRYKSGPRDLGTIMELDEVSDADSQAEVLANQTKQLFDEVSHGSLDEVEGRVEMPKSQALASSDAVVVDLPEDTKTPIGVTMEEDPDPTVTSQSQRIGSSTTEESSRAQDGVHAPRPPNPAGQLVRTLPRDSPATSDASKMQTSNLVDFPSKANVLQWLGVSENALGRPASQDSNGQNAGVVDESQKEIKEAIQTPKVRFVKPYAESSGESDHGISQQKKEASTAPVPAMRVNLPPPAPSLSLKKSETRTDEARVPLKPIKNKGILKSTKAGDPNMGSAKFIPTSASSVATKHRLASSKAESKPSKPVLMVEGRVLAKHIPQAEDALQDSTIQSSKKASEAISLSKANLHALEKTTSSKKTQEASRRLTNPPQLAQPHILPLELSEHPSAGTQSKSNANDQVRPKSPKKQSAPAAAPESHQTKQASPPSPRSPRSREELPPIDGASLLKSAWDTASSAPTSVMSEATRRTLSNILVPYKSFDTYHGLLEEYCKAGKASAVKVLLQNGCNPGTKQRPRRAPLLAAIEGASARHNKCVRELIKHDVDVNVRSRRSKNPALHIAIEAEPSNSYEKLVWLLINGGADLDKLDGNGDSVLTKVFSGPDLLPLEKHRLGALALLLQGGVPVNQQAPGTGNTPLHLAVRRKDKWAVAMLLFKGADVNAKNFSGATALQLTANQFRGELSASHAQVLDLLLKANASIDETAGALNRTALHLAVVSGTSYAVRLLLDHGANPALVDGEGRDAMQLAIQGSNKLTSHADKVEDHIEIMDQLLRVLGRPWQKVKEGARGLCPVEAACSKGGLDILRLLVEKGGLTGASIFQDGTVLSCAKKKGCSEAVNLLKR